MKIPATLDELYSNWITMKAWNLKRGHSHRLITRCSSTALDFLQLSRGRLQYSCCRIFAQYSLDEWLRSDCSIQRLAGVYTITSNSGTSCRRYSKPDFINNNSTILKQCALLTWSLELTSAFASINFSATPAWPSFDARWSGEFPALGTREKRGIKIRELNIRSADLFTSTQRWNS